MSRSTTLIFAALVCVALPSAAADDRRGQREFPASAGGRLVLELDAGGSVEIAGTGGSSVIVDYSVECDPACDVEFTEISGGLRVRTRHTKRTRNQSSGIEFSIRVPERFDVEIDSHGGSLSIEGVDGTFEGKTMGGGLTLRGVRGEARLKTMGGAIRLTDSDLDGSLHTMGGKVLFENVVGDVTGRSMGGDVRFVNVQRRDGGIGSPERTGEGLDDIDPETVQISTMGGDIEVAEAPEGADVHTMGGDIEIEQARRFVRAKTMGGDIEIEAIDGWVQATTMGGDIDVRVEGTGEDVTLTSMSGDIVLTVPAGSGLDLDLEIAFTKNSRGSYRIRAPGDLPSTVSDTWDDSHGTPRKTIRMAGTANGGGTRVTVRTVNGNITIDER